MKLYTEREIREIIIIIVNEIASGKVYTSERTSSLQSVRKVTKENYFSMEQGHKFSMENEKKQMKN